MGTKSALFLSWILVISTTHLASAQADTLEMEKKWHHNLSYQLAMGGLIEKNEPSGRTYTPTVAGTIYYRILNKIDLGIGIGYDEYHQFLAMPYFATIKYSLLNKANTPILYSKFGESLVNKKDHIRYSEVNGQQFVEFGAGYEWQLENVRLGLNLGWRRQYLKTSSSPFDVWYYTLDATNSYYAFPSSQRNVTWELNRTVFNISLVF